MNPQLPQYGFGATYAFDALVDHHHFLYRVHTPKHRESRPSSPSPRPTSPSLSASLLSIRSADSFPCVTDDDDDVAPGDPYFLSPRFKDQLSSTDVGTRRRTLSTLSSLSGRGSFYASEDGYGSGSDPGDCVAPRVGLTRSTSMQSRAHVDSTGLVNPSQCPHAQGQDQLQTQEPDGAGMTYADLVRHLDWTTRASSPYVTTSFSFFWCLWEAVRRYKLGVKHDVEIAVVDARKVAGRARTALEVLRSVEGDKQDKSYWKWYRFALESQDVLVFGAIPGDAIYASIPLTQILPRLPSYFFADDVPKPLVDPREQPEAEEQSANPFFPTTPSRSASKIAHERTRTAHLLSTLAWDVGTALKPPRKSKASSTAAAALVSSPPGGGKPAPPPRHTSHRDFCRALTHAFLAPARSDADRLRDATTGAVRLAELLVEPWFRARCAEGAAYPFRHGDDDDDDDDAGSEKDGDRVMACLGLAGDGCARQRVGGEDEEESEEGAARGEAGMVLAELALTLARWPAAWWAEEHAGEVEGVLRDVVRVCVEEASRGVGVRIGWGVERERRRVASTASMASLSGSLSGSLSLGSLREEKGREEGERRGREETRLREQYGKAEKRSSPLASPARRRASGGSPTPTPWPPFRPSPSPSPYKPRARSPLGASPAPVVIFKPQSAVDPDSETEMGAGAGGGLGWAPSTPPPTPPLPLPLGGSGGSGGSGLVGDGRRASPPPPASVRLSACVGSGAGAGADGRRGAEDADADVIMDAARVGDGALLLEEEAGLCVDTSMATSASPAPAHHHRRHSSLGIEHELSPVREVEAEAEGEGEGLRAGGLGCELGEFVREEGEREKDGEAAPAVEFAVVAHSSSSSSSPDEDPFADRELRRRSSTLDSIPEEDGSLAVELSSALATATAQARCEAREGERRDAVVPLRLPSPDPLRPAVDGLDGPSRDDDGTGTGSAPAAGVNSAPALIAETSTSKPPAAAAAASSSHPQTPLAVSVSSPSPSPMYSGDCNYKERERVSPRSSSSSSTVSVRSGPIRARRASSSPLPPPPPSPSPPPDFEKTPDGSYSLARTSSWAMSCFVCGVMAALFVASSVQRRPGEMMGVGNRFC